MSLLTTIRERSSAECHALLGAVTPRHVEAVLARSRLTTDDFLVLASDAATASLEPMAQKARSLTRRHFGNAIVLFTPLYVSNYCDNACAYCSFAKQFRISRRHLSLDEVAREADAIAATGMRHVLVLTGESRSKAPVDYLEGVVRTVRQRLSSIGIEVYPMAQDEYARLVSAGVDALTVYQEVYDEDAYRRLHRGGPKSNYEFRLDAPDRACRAGIHAVTVGPLLGLADYRVEAYRAALHVAHLRKAHPSVEVSVALPRMRPLVAEFEVACPVSDRAYVQLLTAFRLVFPTIGITVSTRESQEFRDNILPLGITRMSAGVSTAVGGHAGEASTAQFEIADTRSVDQMRLDLMRLGFQAVMHDWHAGMLTP